MVAPLYKVCFRVLAQFVSFIGLFFSVGRHFVKINENITIITDWRIVLFPFQNFYRYMWNVTVGDVNIILSKSDDKTKQEGKK